MSGMFDDFKEQVRSQANIVEIISEYVPLKKRGGSFWGCCPFHGEKTPSFSVTPDKNFFYCYGCHVGGDVFTFVMKMENCTFPEALKLLANKLGIAVPEKEKTKAELEREKQAKQVIAANELATRFFQACLTMELKHRSISQDAALHLRLSSGFQSGWHCRTITHCFQHLENVDVVLDCWCRPGWR